MFWDNKFLILLSKIWLGGIGVDGVGVNLLFCVSLSYLHFACVFALFFVFVCVFRISFFPLFFVFLSFHTFLEILVFSARFQAVAVDYPSVFGYEETAKTRKKREFRSDPIYTNPIRNFPSDAPFSRLRPNDPSFGLTNDMKEDPITESHRPIAKKHSPKIFWCNVTGQHSTINYFRIVWWM